jgi:hypothetical protein
MRLDVDVWTKGLGPTKIWKSFCDQAKLPPWSAFGPPSRCANQKRRPAPPARSLHSPEPLNPERCTTRTPKTVSLALNPFQSPLPARASCPPSINPRIAYVSDRQAPGIESVSLTECPARLNPRYPHARTLNPEPCAPKSVSLTTNPRRSPPPRPAACPPAAWLAERAGPARGAAARGEAQAAARGEAKDEAEAEARSPVGAKASEPTAANGSSPGGLPSSTFADLRSPCTIWLACRYARPAHAVGQSGGWAVGRFEGYPWAVRAPSFSSLPSSSLPY